MANSAKSKRGGQRSGGGTTPIVVGADKFGNTRELILTEARIRYNKTETAVLLDENGKILFNKSDGHESQVAFSPDEVRKMEGQILTHNHPSGNTFSGQDIAMMGYSRLNEIRATGENGTHSLKRLEGDFPKRQEMALKFHKVTSPSSAIKKKADAEYSELTMKYALGTITHAELSKEVSRLNKSIDDHAIKWLSKNASKYGYDYRHEFGVR